MTVGNFEWFELITANADAAKAFYTEVVGWGTDSMDMGPAGNYLMFTAGDKTVAGVTKPQMDGVPQHWLGYVNHDDVDAAVAFVKEKGGQVHVDPFDVPGVGRMAIFADPYGASLAVITPADKEAGLDAPNVGEFCWYEHMSQDVDGARAFYEELFGWNHGGSMDMPSGTYHMYNIGESTRIGFMQMDGPTYWAYYVETDDLDGVVARTESNGGETIQGPMDIPNGKIAILKDPQGGVFSMHSAA